MSLQPTLNLDLICSAAQSRRKMLIHFAIMLVAGLAMLCAVLAFGRWQSQLPWGGAAYPCPDAVSRSKGKAIQGGQSHFRWGENWDSPRWDEYWDSPRWDENWDSSRQYSTLPGPSGRPLRATSARSIARRAAREAIAAAAVGRRPA